jgi:hypothetical protein
MNNETLQIHLNSKNANVYYNIFNSDCLFFLPNMEAPIDHHLYLSVQHAVIPFSFYNIDTNNNLLYINVINFGILNITIPIGNYNINQLVLFLNAQFNLNLCKMLVKYDIIANKLTFTNTLYEFYIDYLLSTCLSVIGFSNSVNSYSNNKILVGLNCVNLCTKQCICISTQYITGNFNNNQKHNSSVICSIPVVVSPNSLINYQNYNNNKFNLYTNFINKIRLKITDQNGNDIDLNGQYFSITLQIDCLKFTL